MKKQRVKMVLWKKIVLISSIVLVVAVPLIYTWASVQAWNVANTTTAQASSDLKTSVDTTLATETAPESIQASLDSVLKEYDDTLQEGLCKLPSFYEWQSGLIWLKDDRQKCLDAAKSSGELATALKNLQAFMKQEVTVAQLIKEATESTASTTDYTATAAAWQKVADDNSLATDDTFKPVGAKGIEVSTAISGGYIALADANAKQDKAAFAAAERALSDSYARFAEVRTVAIETRSGLIDTVINTYNNL